MNRVTINFYFSLSSVVRKISVDLPEIINSINDAGVVCCFATVGIGNVGTVIKICSRSRERSSSSDKITRKIQIKMQDGLIF